MSSDHLVAGRYRLDRRIGAGAMGQVWAATDERLRRPVAVKLVDLTLASDPTVGERFKREAYATAQLSHPNIVTIFDAGTDGSTAYLVMELLAGQSVAEVVRTRGPLPVDEARRVAAEVARALEATHAIGVVHRDIKPANVMLSGSSVKLLDFGIAQLAADAAHATLTAPASTIGTAAYMSPEQAQGLRAGPASDIYSLGCLLMTMLTGQPPFTGANAFQVAHAQIADTPPLASARRSDVPWEVDDLVRRMLTKDPAQRPGAAAVRARLQSGPGGYVPPEVAGADDPTRVVGAGAAAAAPSVIPPRAGGTAVLPPGVVPSAVPSPVGAGGPPSHGGPPSDGWFRRGIKLVVVSVVVLLVALVAWSVVNQVISRFSASAAPSITVPPTTPAVRTTTPRPIPTFVPPPLPSIPLPSIPFPTTLPSLPDLPSAGELALRASIESVSVALSQVSDDGVRRDLQDSWAATTPALLAGRNVDARLAAFTRDVQATRDDGLTLPEYVAIRLALNAVGAAV